MKLQIGLLYGFGCTLVVLLELVDFVRSRFGSAGREGVGFRRRCGQILCFLSRFVQFIACGFKALDKPIQIQLVYFGQLLI